MFYSLTKCAANMFLLATFVAVLELLGAHNTGQFLCSIKGWAGKACTTASSLNMVHSSTLDWCWCLYCCIRGLVKADEHGPATIIAICHQPPSVLYCPSIWTSQSSWYHHLRRARGHCTYSAEDSVAKQMVQCLLILHSIFSSTHCGYVQVGSGGLIMALYIIFVGHADVVGCSTYICLKLPTAMPL